MNKSLSRCCVLVLGFAGFGASCAPEDSVRNDSRRSATSRLLPQCGKTVPLTWLFQLAAQQSRPRGIAHTEDSDARHLSNRTGEGRPPANPTHCGPLLVEPFTQ